MINVQFATRMDGIRSSAIRELLKLTEKPDIISFAGGLPAPELFPIAEMQKISLDVLENDGLLALQYSSTEGFLPLRKILAERMAKVHVNANPDEILITSGSQQGLDFAGRILLDPDDVVICESPSYLGAINAFRAYQCKFIEIPMDDDGMIVSELENVLKTQKRVKFIYTIPDFQNPTGRTMSLDRRIRLLELAQQYGLYIVEDNPYGELRFEGEILPSIKHFDTDGRVIFLGTMSKTFCPGLRIGWVNATSDILQKFIVVKQGADLQSSTIAQRQTAKFLENYSIDAHIEKIKAVYKRRRNLMLSSMEREFPKNLSFTKPLGGLFTWVTLPPHLNAEKILQLALKENVAFVPGSSFFANGGQDNHCRLNYSNMPDSKIEDGIARLGKVLRSVS